MLKKKTSKRSRTRLWELDRSEWKARLATKGTDACLVTRMLWNKIVVQKKKKNHRTGQIMEKKSKLSTNRISPVIKGQWCWLAPATLRCLVVACYYHIFQKRRRRRKEGLWARFMRLKRSSQHQRRDNPENSCWKLGGPKEGK